MKLYVDLESLQLIEGPGFRNPITSLRFKRGDAALLEVEFLNGGGTASSIGDPEELELRFGAKQFNRFDLGYLVFSDDWEIPSATAEQQFYRCSPSFNTLQLDAAIGVGSSSSTELSEITLMGEITWREGMGEPTSTRTFLVVVENDVNRGTEGIPISADPAYPAPENVALFGSVVRHDVTQALTLAAKLRARQNIGADVFTVGPVHTGLGYSALAALSTGTGNTAVGTHATATLTSASDTTAVGSEALRYNNASGNTAVGTQALTTCTTGISNTAVGANALSSITGSTLSCAMGFNAGRYITAGGNTMVGAKTGLSYWNTGVDGQVNLTTGAGNTIIGCNAGVNSLARKQVIVLGKDATALNDGELVFGAPLVGIRGGRTGTTPTGLTGAITAPTNATTPVGWLEIRINGTLFKTPLYQ